jgi:phage terminase large subunit-like protein
MASNAAVAQDPADNLKPAKDKSTDRIDGIVALIMALGRAMLPVVECGLCIRFQVANPCRKDISPLFH